MNLSVDEVNEIFTHYGINDKCINVIRIQAGWENNNYKIETTSKPLFLKEITMKKVEELERMLETLAKLEENKFPTPYPFKTLAGSSFLLWNEKKILVYSFVDGECPERMTPLMTKQVGEALAILHNLPKLESNIPNYTFHISNSRKFLNENESKIDKDFAAFLEKEISYIERNIEGKEFPVGIIHGDLFLDNTMFDGEKLVAIIDFEDITQLEVILDIGMTILGCCYDGDEINQKCVITFLEGYEVNRKITSIERENIYLYVRYAILGVLIWRYCKWNLDDESPNDLKSRYLIMKSALEKLDPSWFQ